MVVTGLEFHRSFWDIVMLLESVKHPSMELSTALVDRAGEDGLRHMSFELKAKGYEGSLSVSAVFPTENPEDRQQPGFREFSTSDNMYLLPALKGHTPPAGLAIPARRAHLSADLIYYWFTLCMGHKVAETKAAIGRKYALDVQKQMKTWLDTLDSFHKYTQLLD